MRQGIKQMNFDELPEEALVPEDEQPFRIPDHWKWVKIGYLSKVVGGGTPKSSSVEYYENGTVPWITPADLTNYDDIYISRGRRNLSGDGLKNSSAKMIPKDSILFSSRAPIGYVALAANDLCTNQGFKSFVPSDVFLPKYGYWYLKYAKPLVEKLASGTTFAEVSGSKIAELPFPIPPLSEQKRIVERIESLLGKITSAGSLLEGAKDTYELQRKAIIAKALQGEMTTSWRVSNPNETAHLLVQEVRKQRDTIQKMLYGKTKSKLNVDGVSLGSEPYTVPESWEWERIGNIVVNVVDGTHHTPTYTTSGIPFLSVKDVKNNKLSFEDTKYISEEEHRELLKRCHPQKGDILITKSGTIGRTAVVETEQEFSLFVSVALIKTAGLSLEPRFIELALEFFVNQEMGNEFVKGTAVKNLHLDQIVKLPIPIPPLHEQKRIVGIVDLIATSLEAYIRSIEEVEQTFKDLANTVLGAAFRGRLTQYTD